MHLIVKNERETMKLDGLAPDLLQFLLEDGYIVIPADVMLKIIARAKDLERRLAEKEAEQ